VLVIAAADPSLVLLSDELALLLGKKIGSQGGHGKTNWRPAEAHRTIATRPRASHGSVLLCKSPKPTKITEETISG